MIFLSSFAATIPDDLAEYIVRVPLILGVGHPFEVADAVVEPFTVPVIDARLALWVGNEGRGDKAVYKEVSVLLPSCTN